MLIEGPALCPTCKGTGNLGRRPGLTLCGVCHGTGRILSPLKSDSSNKE